jgi:hypothetical protein
VRQQPEGREVGVKILGEHGFQVDFDESWTSQARVVAQDAQRQAVADHCPQRGVGGIERFLGEHERRAAANAPGLGVLLAEALGSAVQVLIMGRQNQRQPAAVSHPANRVAVTRNVQVGGVDEVGEAENVAQQGHEECTLGDVMGVYILPLAQGLQVCPQVLGDLPVTRDLVAQLQALGNAVVAFALFCLLGCLQSGQARQFVGRNESALDADRLVGAAGWCCAGPWLRPPPRERARIRP